MQLKIRRVEKQDNVEHIFNLLKKYNLTGPNYAHCRNIWNFQHLENPEKKYWNAIITNEKNDAVLGYFGLVPFPFQINSEVFRAAYISAIVADEGVRKENFLYNNTRTSPTFPLIEEGCQNAFKEGVALIFGFSVIPYSFWKSRHFHNLSIEMKTTWHVDVHQLYQQYIHEFQARIKTGWQRLFIKPYSLLMTALQIFSKKCQIFFLGINMKKHSGIDIEAFKNFDEHFKPFFSSFYSENSGIVTYDRDLRYLNWRFNNDQYRRFKFFIGDLLVGYCIILKREQAEGKGFWDMYEFIVLKEHMRKIPQILDLLLQKGLKFKFTHYLSCQYSQELFKECSQSGYQILFTIPEIIRTRVKKIIRQSSFYFRLNPNSSLKQKYMEHLKDEKNWFINPLFFGPRYYPSIKVGEETIEI